MTQAERRNKSHSDSVDRSACLLWKELEEEEENKWIAAVH